MQNYDLRGLWSLTSSTLTRMRMRMKQHVYLVGSRNYSNFNNLSAARLPNKYTSILIGRCWANEGTPVAAIIIYLFIHSAFLRRFVCFIHIFWPIISWTAAADRVPISNRHFAYQWLCIHINMYIFFANSILINIVYVPWIRIHVCVHLEKL